MKGFLKGVAIAGAAVAAGYIVIRAIGRYEASRIDEFCEDEFEDDFSEDDSDGEAG